jgi:hypothetical protein
MQSKNERKEKKKMMKTKQLWRVTVSEKVLLQSVEDLKVSVVFGDVNLAYKLPRKHRQIEAFLLSPPLKGMNVLKLNTTHVRI